MNIMKIIKNKINEKNKEYYEENKNKINEKIKCDKCGCMSSKSKYKTTSTN